VSVPPLFGAEEPLARAGQVGCLARVVSVRKLPGRQVRIVVRGLERFSITTQPVSDPWQQASVAPYVDFDESATLLSSFADEVRQYFIRYQRASGKIGDARPERASKLPEDPAELSMLLPALLSLDDETSQRFLASRSTLMRLRELAAVLGPAVLTAESSAEVHSRSRTNGHGVKRS
jgi:Lon protease-like protein